MSAPADPSIVAFGDAALLVRLGERIDPLINSRVHALAEAVRRRRAGGAAQALGVPVPAYASLLVPFDSRQTAGEEVATLLRELLAEVPDEPAPTSADVLEIGVHYGGDDGPDLTLVAERTGLSPAAVVELHASVVYRVYMLGFAPGFAYLGELPAELEVPRHETPRQRVPAGSVAIAGRQTAVYPLPTPGGWQLIGRTDAVLWEAERDPPALLGPGRRVRFVAA